MNNEISGKTLLSVTASIAATIIPDTPIVSIAGATLSEITTTTTSTTTTPTPTPTPTSFIPSNKTNKDHINANLPNNPMSDAAVAKSAGGNGTAAANNTTSNTPADTGGITGKNSSLEHTTIVNIANAGKTDDANTNASTDTKKSDISDLEEPELKKLLDEAYNYKTPKDKKDKSEIFLDLLQKVENEDLGITSTRTDSHRHHPHSQSRHQQKQGGSLQDLLQLPSDYRRQNHTSRHKKNTSVSSRQREGGSLPSNVNVANCLLSSFGQQSSVYTDKRVRRGILPGVESATVALNSNKTLVGVVGLAVSDPNANCLLNSFEQQTPVYADKPVRRILGLAGGDPNATTGGTGTSGSAGTNSVGVCSKDSGNSVGASVTSVIGGAGNMATTASGHSVGGTMATGAGIVNNPVKTANSISGSSDYIINIGDMIDIQQQQQILPSKAQDGGQGLPYYERVDIDMRIPRPNLHRGEGVDFAPAHSHHYVDEVIRFHQIDGGDGSLCESGEVAISVNNLGNKLKSAAASCSLPMPLDERYRSIKSVMGEKGDNAGVSLNAAVTAKSSGTITANSGVAISNSSNNSAGGVGTNSIGIGSYTKSLPLSRQTDENGNDCERQQHNSSSSSSITVSAGQSQAKAKAKKKPQKDNTIPVDVENEAGYRGKDPVEVLLKFIEEDSKQSGSGGSKFAENNKKKERKKEKVKQSKIKKSNSLEELRSCAKIDVGELKQSAATTESNNVTMRNKGSGGGGGKGGKNNSASIADINKNFDGGSKEGATTSPTSGGKSTTVVATNANTTASNRKGERRSWGTEELQYLGTEGSVGGAGSNSGSVASSGEDKVKEKKDKKSKEKDKDKERDVEKDKGKEKEKDKESDRQDKLTNNKLDGNTKLDKHDRNDKIEKAEKQEKIEKLERTDKLEKRKRSESIMHTPIANSVERQDAGTPIFSAIDLLSMNALISETAEFHVVTKKKKPKKQRASIDETHFTQNSNYNNSNNNSGHNSYNNNNNNNCGTTMRAHNMVLNAQKNNNNSNNNNNNNNVSQQQQQQQQQSRYKYHNNNAHGFNSYGNGGGSGSNNNSFGEDGRLDYRNNYNSNYNNNSYNNNYTHQQYGYQHQQQQGPYHHHQHYQQQQQQQQHHHHAHNVNSGATDKSRRKSTSSVPPSEKSDSSDLDSVHSLPIESTTASATKNRQRHKQCDASTTTTPETPKSTASGGSPGSAPISYAHIAAAAAADRWPSLDAANNNNATANGINNSPTIANNTCEQLPTQVANNAEIATPATLSNASNSPSTAAAVAAAATSTASKQGKSKKLTIKPDFPELGSSNATVATTSDNSKPNIAAAVIPIVAAASKTISYSQSLVAAPAQINAQPNIVAMANGEKVAGHTVDAAVAASATAAATAVTDSNNVTDVNKVEASSGSTARLPQQQPMQQQQSPQQQMQTLKKSKSVEHDSYSFNSSNLDQQYPALAKTMKRNSATNVSISPPTAAATLVAGAVCSSGIPTLAASSMPPANAASSTKFNFAAAAKQLVVKSCSVSQSLLTQDSSPAAAATQPATVAAITTSGAPAAYTAVPANAAITAITAAANVTMAPVTMPARKSKEKSPTAVFAPPTANNALANATTNLAAQTAELSAAFITARKSKKEKSQPVLSADATISLTTNAEPHAHVAQKLSTATQTQATSMDIVTSGKTTRSQPNMDAGSETVVMPPIVSKPQRLHVSNATNSGKSHTAAAATTASNFANAGAVVGALNCSAPSNRPAVIILNDDRAGDSSAVGIEFTFGDFNEDELKFFDDNLAEDECTDELAADELATQQQLQPATAATLSTAVANSAHTKNAVAPVELASDNNVTPFVENAALYAAVRATSPQPTFIGPPLSNIPVVKDIAHIVKTPVIAVPNVVSNSVDQANVIDNNSAVSAAANDAELQQQQQQQLQRRNSETQKLQQLETCNDIETAIIAAARAAAEQQQQQPPMQPPPLQQQRSYRHKHQQQYRSTSYGNAYEPPQQREQRSQSAYTRDTPNNYQQQHHYHSQYHQQQHYHYHQSSSSNSASRSRSSSSNNNANSYDVSGSTPPPQSPNATAAVVVNMQRKEFDIHFIPPTVSNAYNALQHNEIIVDFIGSAWEEVAKVTKFYEGQ
nr:uncharacterized protein LOC106621228 isoform X1 [Bactrocera oleae]XP_036215258.1 uncharacterized protein LOC106621228 isoform X1 [Bactrocera oleae]XP_036215259.1 uncharacterized protein LOC106621228 isoform X1 [Bactrocera oleae]XP_036215260.1 uncharacterized protein LOC106621228 isoform X1 [Bactrocera oleae]XP_036215261.1 uncharacterized protein LOC106621228 isoform X1 [Bactrocera oleae]